MPIKPPYKALAKEWSIRIARDLAIVFGLYIVLINPLVWLWPWSLIAIEVLALIWCLVRSGEGKRYSLRGLLILTAGVAIIMATAAFVPGPMLGGGGGRSYKQTYIDVVDKTTSKPVNNAEVVLSHRNEDLVVVATYQGATNSEGVAELTCYVGGTWKNSILRTWNTYNFAGWLLEAKAAGYRPAEKVLSDVTVDGGGGGPVNFRIELEAQQRVMLWFDEEELTLSDVRQSRDIVNCY